MLDFSKRLKTSVIRDKHLGARVVQRVIHLASHPPGVHADDGRSKAIDSPMRHHPLGIIAHGNGNMITRTYPLLSKPPSELGDHFCRL